MRVRIVTLVYLNMANTARHDRQREHALTQILRLSQYSARRVTTRNHRILRSFHQHIDALRTQHHPSVRRLRILHHITLRPSLLNRLQPRLL